MKARGLEPTVTVGDAECLGPVADGRLSDRHRHPQPGELMPGANRRCILPSVNVAWRPPGPPPIMIASDMGILLSNMPRTCVIVDPVRTDAGGPERDIRKLSASQHLVCRGGRVDVAYRCGLPRLALRR